MNKKATSPPKSKLLYLEGLRGIAAAVVLLNHFVSAFLPALYNGIQTEAHFKSQLELFISHSWLNIFYNGHFAVIVFFVLSGFVLSKSFYTSRDVNGISLAIFKRYFRLAIPVLFSIIFAVLLMKMNLFANDALSKVTKSSWLAQFYSFPAIWTDALLDGVIGVFRGTSFKYNMPLWSIYFELLGSYLVYIVCLIDIQHSLKRFFLVLIVLAFYGTYYLPFLIGLILAKLFVAGKLPIQKSFALVPVTGLAIFFGAFPAGVAPGSGWYKMIFELFGGQSLLFCHTLGAGLLVLVLLMSRKLQILFGTKLLTYWGKISFSVYLTHLAVLCSFSAFAFPVIQGILVSYWKSVLATFLVTMPVIVIVGILFEKYVDQLALKFSGKLLSLRSNGTRVIGRTDLFGDDKN
ncbi:MAG: acyltransferase [Bdellovibrionaceae bacterium]|nr:acyltransferase [Pseudobdellovibrionaceae bacterium]